MPKHSLRDLKTFGNLTDRRRARTPHGAYIELAMLALHKHRLLKERHSAESRDADIEAQLQEMHRKAAVLRSFVEDPRSFAVQAPQETGRAVRQAPENVESKPCGLAIREQEFRY